MMGYAGMEKERKGRPFDYLCLGETHVLDRLIKSRHILDCSFYALYQPDSGYGVPDLPGL